MAYPLSSTPFLVTENANQLRAGIAAHAAHNRLTSACVVWINQQGSCVCRAEALHLPFLFLFIFQLGLGLGNLPSFPIWNGREIWVTEILSSERVDVSAPPSFIYIYISYIGNEKGLKVLGLIGTREKIAIGDNPCSFLFFWIFEQGRE